MLQSRNLIAIALIVAGCAAPTRSDTPPAPQPIPLEDDTRTRNPDGFLPEPPRTGVVSPNQGQHFILSWGWENRSESDWFQIYRTPELPPRGWTFVAAVTNTNEFHIWSSSQQQFYRVP